MKQTTKYLSLGLVIAALLTLALPLSLAAQGFNGTLKLGYVYFDDDGNRSVDRSAFNEYEGANLGLEGLRYRFDNGLRLRGDLRHLTMNNRNLSLGLDKAGLFGITLSHHKYRRTYSFDGDKSTMRHRTQADFWVQPHRYVKLFAGGGYVKKQGDLVPLYDVLDQPQAEMYDYAQTSFHGGVQANYLGRSVRAEYRTLNFKDDANTARDQQRQLVRFQAQVPLPKYDWITATGGFQHFESKYKDTDFKFSANTGWAGGLVQLPQGFSLRYHFKFDRASTDSDLVATDNLSNSFYAGYQLPGKVRLAAGYQTDVNDDYEDEIQGSAVYFSGWFEPAPFVELRGEYGSRDEDIEDGHRLIGEQTRNRHKVSVKLKNATWGALTLHEERRERENPQLGSDVKFNRFGGQLVMLGNEKAEMTLPLLNKVRLVNVMGGYSYADGQYMNSTSQFDFISHTLNGAVNLKVGDRLELGHQFVYYRSKRDLDIESFRLTFSGRVEIANGFGLEALYRVYNFDDLAQLVVPYDQYYTANVVEINLTKDLSY